MDINTAREIEASMKIVVQQQAPEEVMEFMQAISEDGVTQAEVDEFRAITIDSIDNPGNYPKYMRYLESTGLMEKEDIPTTYDAGFLLSMMGMAGIAQDAVNG
jgi:hypothetical protein